MESGSPTVWAHASVISVPLVIVSVIFPILSLGSIVLRGKARHISKQTLAPDDWWIVATWILTLGLSLLIWVFAATIGTNFTVDWSNNVQYSVKCLLITGAFVSIPVSAVKISILLFYRRFFRAYPLFSTAVYITIATVTIWCIVFFVVALLQTDPVDSLWRNRPGRLRFNIAQFAYAQVGSSIALDILVLCFPLPLVLQLHLDWKRKIGVVAMFGLGSFCVVAAIVRFALLHTNFRAPLDGEGFSQVYFQSLNIMFMIIEPNCSIIAACLPCYGPLFGQYQSHSSTYHSGPRTKTTRSSGFNSDDWTAGSQVELTYLASNEVNGPVNDEHSQQRSSEHAEYPSV